MLFKGQALVQICSISLVRDLGQNPTLYTEFPNINQGPQQPSEVDKVLQVGDVPWRHKKVSTWPLGQGSLCLLLGKQLTQNRLPDCSSLYNRKQLSISHIRDYVLR